MPAPSIELLALNTPESNIASTRAERLAQPRLDLVGIAAGGQFDRGARSVGMERPKPVPPHPPTTESLPTIRRHGRHRGDDDTEFADDPGRGPYGGRQASWASRARHRSRWCGPVARL